MRLFRCLSILLILMLAMALSACSGSASVSGILSQKGITDKTLSQAKVEIRFLKESKGANYKSADVSSNMSFLGQLLGLMQGSKHAEAPESQFTPELKSDYEIIFTDTAGKTVSFYYAAKENYLIFAQSKTDKSGETLEYLYFTPDKKLAGLIGGQKGSAALEQSNEVKPFRSMEELKSSIDPDELAEAGTDLDFEFFTEATPDNTGTACRIYTSQECPSVSADSYLITAYGKSKTGQQQKLSITSIKANSNYTIIDVEPPDDSLDVGEGEDVPEAYAATVKISAIDPNKWIVFVGGDGNILDVILPEDLGPVPSQAPAGPTSSSVSATPTEEPPEGGDSTSEPSDED